MKLRFLIILALATTTSLHARPIIVAKSGGDFPTISAGLDAATAGDTVFVKAGTYSEFVTWPKSGSASGGSIVLKAFGDGAAILSGQGLTATQSNAQLLLISAKSHVAVIGIEVANFTTASGSIFLKGIQVEGASQHVVIKKCRVHAITTTNTTTNAGANAIGVFGIDGTNAITDLTIDSCEVYGNETGYSEAVSIDGNVDGFAVTHCFVHDNNNIGILIAGYYGMSPNPATDQARHGRIADNRVERCSSCSNASYRGDCAADGIYSDGGGKSVFERNIISECDIGIEAGAELPSAIDDSMVVRDNLILKCNTGGIFIGGYETGRGVTVNCRVENNTLYMNDSKSSGSGEFLIQKAHGNIVRNNIFYTTAQKMAMSVAFSATYSYNNIVENNLYRCATGGAGIAGTNLDSHAKTGDPKFVNSQAGDFHLLPGSAAIDSCAVSYVPAVGELDLDGKARKIGAVVDIGAYEFAGSSAVHAALRNSYRATAAPRVVIDPCHEGLPRVFIAGGSQRLVLANGRTVPALARHARLALQARSRR